MSVSDLYIIAAGNGSRLKCDMPKALIPIANEPCLTTTLQQISHKFRRVFVVTNVEVRNKWCEYFGELRDLYPELCRAVIELPIKSGLGDGHATLQGLVMAEKHDPRLSQDVIIVWGDVFFPEALIIDELISLPSRGSGLLPAILESSPYVALNVDEQMRCIAADFSKHGERRPYGFHDQSVFRFDRARLTSSLKNLHNALWKNDRYIAPGGELSLLFAFHQLYNAGDPAYVYESRYSTLTFNTVEEVSSIQREITARWKREFRGDYAERCSADHPPSDQ
jgi:bifunctional N-acetylglucosamine-1-phosphate-uridyltransferase/glucosamine-1-phosphate-acetyltransferase GlmU-like protein